MDSVQMHRPNATANMVFLIGSPLSMKLNDLPLTYPYKSVPLGSALSNLHPNLSLRDYPKRSPNPCLLFYPDKSQWRSARPPMKIVDPLATAANRAVEPRKGGYGLTRNQAGVGGKEHGHEFERIPWFYASSGKGSHNDSILNAVVTPRTGHG